MFTIPNISTILASLDITFTIDKTSRAIKHTRCKSVNHVVILTNRQAFREYDDHHPERILCIIINSHSYIIITLNREIDARVMIRSWWNRYLSNADLVSECVICFEKPKTYTNCCFCGAIVCGKCFERMHGHQADSDDESARQCVVCRLWTLHGSSFGTPFLQLKPKPLPNTRPHLLAVDQFVNIISKLDGLVEIIPRINRGYLISNVPLRICRMSYTTRYSPHNETVRMKSIRTSLCRIVDKYKGAHDIELLLYVLRSTYAIDKTHNKPVTELSVFQIKGDTLNGYSNDAYISVFNESKTIYLKTELVPPIKHDIPNSILQIFADISKEYAFPVKISMLSLPDKLDEGSLVTTFDIQADGAISSIHSDMLGIEIYNLINCRKSVRRCFATVRIHRYDDKNKSDFAAFEFDDSSYRRVGKQQAEQLWKANHDNLKDGNRIVEFC